MGQKIHPLIFRSKNFPYYTNRWNNFISTYKNVEYYLTINMYNKGRKLNILYIQSNHNYNHYIYNIILTSKLIDGKYKRYIKMYLLKLIEKNLSTKTSLKFNLLYLKEPLLSTKFILIHLYKKLSNTKDSLRKIIPQLASLINKKYKIRGFKCVVSGKIQGVQMAKIETFNFNESSLQDKTLDVKYSCISVPTKYGLLGIKIWLFLKK